MKDNILGLKIKQLRSDYSIKIGKKFTQKGLSEELGITRSYLGDIESGRTKPNKELLKKIADFFNVDIEYFYNESLHNKHDEDQDEGNEEEMKDNDIRRIERARKKMNPEQKERMMKILESVFDDFFED